MKEYVFDIVPRPKPRMTKKSIWKYKWYFEYCNALKWEMKKQNFEILDVLPVIMYHIPMPKSWTKKKKETMNMRPHQTLNGPDLTNLNKAFEDICLENDSIVWRAEPCDKRWAYNGSITVWQ